MLFALLFKLNILNHNLQLQLYVAYIEEHPCFFTYMHNPTWTKCYLWLKKKCKKDCPLLINIFTMALCYGHKYNFPPLNGETDILFKISCHPFFYCWHGQQHKRSHQVCRMAHFVYTSGLQGSWSLLIRSAAVWRHLVRAAVGNPTCGLPTVAQFHNGCPCLSLGHKQADRCI